MSIVTRMKADRIVARVSNKGAFALLTNVLGEFDSERTKKVNLNKSEDEVILPIIQIAIAHAKEELETLKQVGAPMSKCDRAMQDINVLEDYLPETLTEEDLREMAAAHLLLGEKMPDMMKNIRNNFVGRFDGKLASTIAKEILG